VKQIALVTYSGCSELTDDDRLLVTALQQCDVNAVPVVWDTPVDWARFDQIILRSCWDYHLRADEFLQWIGEIERLRVPLHNSASLVRWNADKTYLRQLQGAGGRIPETVWIGGEEEATVHGIMESQGWDSAVVKPTVSASAHRLTRVFKGDPVVRVNGPAMVQEFIPEILVHGEWSVIFISGEFSHAALKLPTAGDFRVQSQFGGTANVGEPCVQMIDVATTIVDALPERPLYARVDGIEDQRGFILMEVELIEPELFLGLGGASDRFAAKILSLPKMQVETRAKDENL
jgi:glutathione synthase/RimK-type ligase-like ATP-grasp enzyme